MKFRFLNFKILLLLILIFPFLAFAQSYLPLVPCGTSANPTSCTRCDLFRLVDNILHLIIQGLVPPIAAVLFIAGGLMILLSGARPELISTGKKIFWNTFIGLIIVYASWLVVNTLIQSFGPDQTKGSWFRFTCSAVGPIIQPPIALCADPPALAAQYNTSSTIKNSPELNSLISCVNSQLSQFIDQAQIYTFEKSNGLCNYTRGNQVCGNCEHRVNSCHYGGPAGSSGALAVDFNAVGIPEQQLFNRLSNIRNQCNFGFIKFETDHTHVSTKTCAGDTGGD